MNLGNRASQHNFSVIPAVHMARSQFDRSFTIKDTFDFDYLIPVFCDEILPGDTCNVTLQTFARLATQKVPIMDNMYIDFFFFFVPNRLVWENWERFNGSQDDPGDSTDYLIPQVQLTTSTGPAVGSIYDKFGIPTQVDNQSVNALPFRAYNLIWNTWFRDQNIQNSLVISKDDGPDADTEYSLLKRNKKHDYFASCLPEPQKGAPVSLPLGTSAPVVGNNMTPQFSGDLNLNRNLIWTNAAGYSSPAPFPSSNNGDVIFGDETGLEADLSEATAATINQLREAMQVQSLLELDNRGGTRYVEILQNHFNVTSPDFRLQRPEYLGGGSTRINSHPVAQTAPTSGSDPQAQLAAFATSSGSAGFAKSFVEHGYVIGLACARADVTYQQGLNRMWSRQTRFDFFWPKLQQLGEQAVLTKEIYSQGTSDDEIVFGYQERYAEYRYKPSEIRGEFRSTFATSLDFWHMAQEFSARPTLNDSFIQQNTPVDRAIAVPTAPHLLFDAWFQYRHARPMMAYSVPASFGRF